MNTCECGCGQITPITQRSNTRNGHVKGLPRRFVLGHNSRTGKATKATKYLAKKHRGRRMLAHVVIAEAALGRPLPSGAQVHHVDGNKFNNANSNLVICQNQKYHRLLHVRQRVLMAGGDPNTQRICTTCQRLVLIVDLVGGITRPSNYCRQCNRETARRRAAREAA